MVNKLGNTSNIDSHFMVYTVCCWCKNMLTHQLFGSSGNMNGYTIDLGF